jgi:hypothetical protein
VRGDQKSATLARAEVEECEALVIDVESIDEMEKERGGDAIVGSAPLAVTVLRRYVFAVDEAAGVGAVGYIEGVDCRRGGGRWSVVLEDGLVELAKIVVYECVKCSADKGSCHA